MGGLSPSVGILGIGVLGIPAETTPSNATLFATGSVRSRAMALTPLHNVVLPLKAKAKAQSFGNVIIHTSSRVLLLFAEAFAAVRTRSPPFIRMPLKAQARSGSSALNTLDPDVILQAKTAVAARSQDGANLSFSGLLARSISALTTKFPLVPKVKLATQSSAQSHGLMRVRNWRAAVLGRTIAKTSVRQFTTGIHRFTGLSSSKVRTVANYVARVPLGSKTLAQAFIHGHHRVIANLAANPKVQTTARLVMAGRGILLALAHAAISILPKLSGKTPLRGNALTITTVRQQSKLLVSLKAFAASATTAHDHLIGNAALSVGRAMVSVRATAGNSAKALLHIISTIATQGRAVSNPIGRLAGKVSVATQAKLNSPLMRMALKAQAAAMNSSRGPLKAVASLLSRTMVKSTVAGKLTGRLAILARSISASHAANVARQSIFLFARTISGTAAKLISTSPLVAKIAAKVGIKITGRIGNEPADIT